MLNNTGQSQQNELNHQWQEWTSVSSGSTIHLDNKVSKDKKQYMHDLCTLLRQRPNITFIEACAYSRNMENTNSVINIDHEIRKIHKWTKSRNRVDNSTAKIHTVNNRKYY